MYRFVITHLPGVKAIIYLFQWRTQDIQHVHKRKLNETEKFVLSAIAFERAVERDYFIFPANISEYGIAVIN